MVTDDRIDNPGGADEPLVVDAADDGAEALGRVAAPPNRESTSDIFYFWTERGRLVERGQIVRTACTLGGRRVEFIALIEEVYRQSRQRDMGEEVDRYDAQARTAPPFASAGFTYAKAVILRTDPVTHAPPTEESVVYLGGEAEAARGYGVDRMRTENRLRVGRLRNGGSAFAGPATIDLAYLLGENGGHLNVNGIAGLGAKSSFLLHIVYLLMRWARQMARPGDSLQPQIVPIIFNVKNFDLFFIDRRNRHWKDEYREDWAAIGVDEPRPFQNVRFLAPQEARTANPVRSGRVGVEAYSWGLADIIRLRLFRFLFADEDIGNPNFATLVGAIEEKLTADPFDNPKLKEDGPQNFQQLLDKLRGPEAGTFVDALAGTRGSLVRRLQGLLQDSDGVLRRENPTGKPLDLPRSATAGPLVIDLFGVRDDKLKRFVVATVLHRLVELRSGNAVEGLRYLVTLDELNRFAPKGGSDPITEMICRVAAEMRSQGIILLGAQQEASRVAPRVIENSGVRAVGRSGSLELSADVWKFLGSAARTQAAQILEDEKLLVQASFRAPMLAKIPFPPWALRKEEALAEEAPSGAAGAFGADEI
jgi:DNA helicase HerA-like ATPase